MHIDHGAGNTTQLGNLMLDCNDAICLSAIKPHWYKWVSIDEQ